MLQRCHCRWEDLGEVRVEGCQRRASWADCLGMIHQRHPDVADQLVHELESDPQTPCLLAAGSAVRELTEVMGFVPPSWDVLTTSLRPVHHEPEEFEPRSHRGWHREARSWVDRQFREGDLFGRLDDTTKALARSQGGSGAGLALSTCPTCRVTRLEPHLFRVLLLRPIAPLLDLA